MNIHQSPLPILIVVIPLLFSFVIPVAGWWRRCWCWPLVLAALSLSLASAVGVAYTVLMKGPVHYYLGGWEPPWGIEYRLDYLSAFMALLLTFMSLMVAIYSRSSIRRDFAEREAAFYCVFLLLVTGLIGIVVTGDMFNLYVFLEIASLTSYALIAIGGERATFAAFRYVIMGTIGACFYLLGVGYLYIVTGSLNMADLVELLPPLYQSKVVLVGFAFLLIGTAIKMALFPLHAWLPDAYTYAPGSVSALLAPLMTKVAAYVLIRIMFGVFAPVFSMEIVPATTLLRWLGGAAILVGCIMALAQTDLKRMLTYILVAEVGYIALGVGLANRNGLTGAILHILNDAFMMACLFFAVGAIVHQTGIRQIQQLRYLHRKMPFTSAALAIAGLSVMGIPPLCGFFSKWYLILGALDRQQWVFAGVLLVSGLLSAAVFFRVIDNAYYDHLHRHASDRPGAAAGPGASRVAEAPMTMLVPLWVSALGVMVLGVLSGQIVSAFIRHAVPAGF